MSIVLGIDTSSRELGLGLVVNGIVAAGWSQYGGQSHSEHLSAALDSLCRINTISPLDISHIAIATGPGSFTGLRIGISFCKGFCFGRAIPVLPVSSLMAAAMALPPGNRSVVAAFEARRGDVFWARFSGTSEYMVRKTDDRLSPIAEFAASISDDDALVTDTMGFARSTVFDFLQSRPNVYPVETVPLQRGVACARLGAQIEKTSEGVHDAFKLAHEIVPRYLREFDIVACAPSMM